MLAAKRQLTLQNRKNLLVQRLGVEGENLGNNDPEDFSLL